MTPEDRIAATSYLLGKAHGGMVFIIINSISADEKIKKLIELEASMRADIDKLFYSDEPYVQCVGRVNRDPQSAE